MAGYEDGENNFSDDDLDDLPVDALQELEDNAIQFTQFTQACVVVNAPPSSDYGDEFDDEDLDDAVVVDEARSVPPVVPSFNRGPPSQVAQREQFRQQRYGAPSILSPNLANRTKPNVPPTLNQPSRTQAPAPIPIQQQQHESMVAQQGSLPEPGEKVDNLQKQIQELMRERDALKQDLNAKAGEIAIVRNKQDKAAKEHEREITTIRKLNEEKLAKQQRELERARIAEKQAATEREFLKQDLSEEAQRARALKAREAAEKREIAGLATPRKKKALPHRDGFDDDEIQNISPSKVSPLKFQKKQGTPTRGAKRKRKAVESPLASLEVIHDELSFPGQREQKVPVIDEAMLARLGFQDDRFDFLGTILDHRPKRDNLRTIEELGKHALPSAPKESFQSIILGSLPTLGLKKPVSDLPIEFCELLISLWAKCIDEKEKYYKAIYLFIDMLTLALELKTSFIAPQIMDSLLPLAQSTLDLIALPRFNGKDPESLEPERKHVDTFACLELLHLMALGCMSEEQHITRFWKLMRWDLIFMLTSHNAPRCDYEVNLKILSTSILRNSFGPILPDAHEVWFGHFLDGLTQPLQTVPNMPLSVEKMEMSMLKKQQLQILHLMTGMTRSPYASEGLVLNKLVIARLVLVMSDEFDALYDYKSGHEDSAQIITMSLRLLYHLITTHERIVKVPDKLRDFPGGFQKYQLCLARLNFFDDGVLEAGIGSDVPMLALELLEGAVTMEEADAIHEAFPS